MAVGTVCEFRTFICYRVPFVRAFYKVCYTLSTQKSRKWDLFLRRVPGPQEVLRYQLLHEAFSGHPLLCGIVIDSLLVFCLRSSPFRKLLFDPTARMSTVVLDHNFRGHSNSMIEK
ncbi:hypothetical protein TNCV_186631 [Trichonephila clavipes]|nr:hypothetical protein TNCV_186631 [Trichonephila clavipes]